MNKKADRAKLFLPFDALKGFKEALKEKEKVIVDRIELSDELQERLSLQISQIRKGYMVKCVYYCNDQYLETTGLVSHIDEISGILTLVKTKIPFKDILKLEFEEDKTKEYY